MRRLVSGPLASGLVLVATVALGSPAAPPAPLVDHAPGPEPLPVATSVLAVSVDGLNPRAIRRLGRGDAPTLHRLIRRGASTLNARSEVEGTETLPNHTSMVSDRRIDAAHAGHGVTWNDERIEPGTVQEAAGHAVSSVFDRVHGAGLRTGLFASKTKFSLFERSWQEAVDRAVVRTGTRRLARVVRRDIRRRQRAFRLVHLAGPDLAGHRHGFMSRPYLRAVARADHQVGTLLRALRTAGKARTTVVIVTSDHGGGGGREHHADPSRLVNHRVPFLVKGPGVVRGADLYDINPDRRNPRRRVPGYGAARQPVRNGALGNLALDVLGLEAVPGSRINQAQDLRVR